VPEFRFQIKDQDAARPDSGYSMRTSLAVGQPFAWQSLLEFFKARAIDGVEIIDQQYQRTVTWDRAQGRMIVKFDNNGMIDLQLLLNGPVNQSAMVRKIRRMLNLDADIVQIESALSSDGRIAPTIELNPGLRVPGTWDSFELGIRAIAGQQITVAGARKILGRLCMQFGAATFDAVPTGSEPCHRLFPGAGRLASADLSDIGLTTSRAKTLQNFSREVSEGNLDLDDVTDPEFTIRQLMSISGIGVWTANYIAMRALGYSDAFPSNDSALLAAARKLGIADSHRSLDEVAQNWRPWRAYAAMHLWQSLKD
jgi:AraC family transcriptional regulator of adaptative response / DNA-3-methyladenine glycosylase II